MSDYDFEEEYQLAQTILDNEEEMTRVFGEHGSHHMIITAKTDEVLTALEVNRQAHAAKYEEAKKAYFVAAEKLLKKELGKIKEGKYKDLSVHLSRPTNHDDHYVTAIRMMELHKRSGAEVIELAAKQVDSFVHDDWDWTHSFRATVGSYAHV